MNAATSAAVIQDHDRTWWHKADRLAAPRVDPLTAAGTPAAGPAAYMWARATIGATRGDNRRVFG